MAYRKSTIRKMTGQPTARKLAHIARELQSMSRKLTGLVTDIQRLELDSAALWKIKASEDSPDVPAHPVV